MLIYYKRFFKNKADELGYDEAEWENLDINDLAEKLGLNDFAAELGLKDDWMDEEV